MQIKGFVGFFYGVIWVEGACVCVLLELGNHHRLSPVIASTPGVGGRRGPYREDEGRAELLRFWGRHGWDAVDLVEVS